MPSGTAAPSHGGIRLRLRRALRGLALEVRPEALMAPSVDARLRAVERVLANSLAKLQAGDFDI